MGQGVERNLRWIPVHEMLAASSPWIAVLVLFNRANFGLDGAIQLAGLHYLWVVVFEVPSGWMSDRLGRVPTLRFAAASWLVGFLCLIVGNDSFLIIAAGMACIALGYAALSGTDVTLHFDTLETLGLEDEYPDRQSSVSSRGRVAAAVAAVSGGAIGLIDIRLTFVAAFALALAQLVVGFQLVEPPRADNATADPFRRQIAACLGHLRNGPLAWIFAYGIAMVVLEHVSFTLLQPWLTESLGNTADRLGATPLVSGITIAITYLVGALFARASAPLARRFGVRVVLVGLGALSAAIVTAMWASTSILIIAFVIFRSAQGAAAPVLISNAASLAVPAQHRATFLSLDSLAGRLSYGTILQVVATSVADSPERALGQLALISWALVAVTAATAAFAYRRYGSDESVR